jgi:hypothetical protein
MKHGKRNAISCCVESRKVAVLGGGLLAFCAHFAQIPHVDLPDESKAQDHRDCS